MNNADSTWVSINHGAKKKDLKKICREYFTSCFRLDLSRYWRKNSKFHQFMEIKICTWKKIQWEPKLKLDFESYRVKYSYAGVEWFFIGYKQKVDNVWTCIKSVVAIIVSTEKNREKKKTWERQRAIVRAVCARLVALTSTDWSSCQLAAKHLARMMQFTNKCVLQWTKNIRLLRSWPTANGGKREKLRDIGASELRVLYATSPTH